MDTEFIYISTQVQFCFYCSLIYQGTTSFDLDISNNIPIVKGYKTSLKSNSINKIFYIVKIIFTLPLTKYLCNVILYSEDYLRF